MWSIKMSGVVCLRKLVVAATALPVAFGAAAAEPTVYLQPNISGAKIVETREGYAVDVNILASDFEQMFQNTANERRGVDLSGPGILEVEIGRFFARRIVLRGRDGKDCAARVERSGEDPANDEAVLVSLKFDCATHDVLYDPSRLLAAHGPRAWQVVTIFHGASHRQVMLNVESPPAPIAGDGAMSGQAIGKNSQ